MHEILTKPQKNNINNIIDDHNNNINNSVIVEQNIDQEEKTSVQQNQLENLPWIVLNGNKKRKNV